MSIMMKSQEKTLNLSVKINNLITFFTLKKPVTHIFLNSASHVDFCTAKTKSVLGLWIMELCAKSRYIFGSSFMGFARSPQLIEDTALSNLKPMDSGTLMLEIQAGPWCINTNMKHGKLATNYTQREI